MRIQSRMMIWLLVVCIARPVMANNSAKAKMIYKDAHATLENRVEDLLSRMTLKEKVLQLNQYTLGTNNIENNKGVEVKNIPAEIGSLIYFATDPELRNRMQRHAMEDSRLGIPILFGYDAIHGFRTIFPIPLAQACSWNPALVEQGCRVSAQECRMSGVDWTFSPMIDVSRDPRWGRVAECYGEDPYANGVFAQAAVKGYQGNSLAAATSVAACLKHYVGYGASEAGRDYVYTEISRQSLWDTYLLPYEMGVKAGAATIMSSFNDISGTPGSANYYTLTEVLRHRWHFSGMVVSDWAAIQQLKSQGMAKNLKEAGA
ncbi:MAG: beta-glucosidase, partial [Prevotella sp.]|nr:beta-glucosidase [Prevotella sp.]